MAVAQSFFNTVMGTILSWTFTVCIILATIKFIQMILAVAGISGGSGSWNPFTSGNGGNGPGGGGNGGGGSGNGGGGSGGDSEDDRWEEIENNPAKLRFWVHTIDGEPVENADIKVWVVKESYFQWGPMKSLGPKSRKYQGTTDKRGTWPRQGDEVESYKKVLGVTLKYKVTYKLDKGEKYKKREAKRWAETMNPVKSKHRKMVVTDTIELSPGETHTEKVEMPFVSEYPLAYEPFIEEVRYDDNSYELYAQGSVRNFGND